MAEVVYILINPTIPDLIKVGRTENLGDRIKSLSRHAGVPVAFECFYACEVEDSFKVEKKIHDAFGDHRVNPKREFFRISPERVRSALELAALREVTPEEELIEDAEERVAFDKEQERRGSFNFKMVGIKPGEILHWTRDENITAKVVDNKNVEFEGKVMSTSTSAALILGWKSAQGPAYWVYQNEILNDRRIRLENED